MQLRRLHVSQRAVEGGRDNNRDKNEMYRYKIENATLQQLNCFPFRGRTRRGGADFSDNSFFSFFSGRRSETYGDGDGDGGWQWQWRWRW